MDDRERRQRLGECESKALYTDRRSIRTALRQLRGLKPTERFQAYRCPWNPEHEFGWHIGNRRTWLAHRERFGAA
jgi:hypothetical protein